VSERALLSPTGAASLAALEHWMQAVLTHPEGVVAGARGARSAGFAIESVVRPSRALTSRDRLEIYSTMIRLRLVDALAQDFPALRFALGPRRFEVLAVAYLAAHPSRHYSLNALGAHLASFVRSGAARIARAVFVSELAALERAVEEVFDERRSSVLREDELLNIPAERWSDVRLLPIPALRLIKTRYPVNAFYQAWRDGRAPAIPQRRTSWVAVYRKGSVVWRMDLDRARQRLLVELVNGATLESAIRTTLAARGVDASRARRKLGAWFRGWAAEGLFRGVELRER
jgi:hypothetical protein